MTDLTPDQMAHVKSAVERSSDRHRFVTALATDRDRKLAVVVVWESDGELRTAIAPTSKAPNWLTNDAQFEEVVADAVARVNRAF